MTASTLLAMLATGSATARNGRLMRAMALPAKTDRRVKSSKARQPYEPQFPMGRFRIIIPDVSSATENKISQVISVSPTA